MVISSFLMVHQQKNKHHSVPQSLDTKVARRDY